MLNRVERTEYSRAATVVYTHEYPIALPNMKAQCSLWTYIEIESQIKKQNQETKTTQRKQHTTIIKGTSDKVISVFF